MVKREERVAFRERIMSRGWGGGVSQSERGCRGSNKDAEWSCSIAEQSTNLWEGMGKDGGYSAESVPAFVGHMNEENKEWWRLKVGQGFEEGEEGENVEEEEEEEEDKEEEQEEEEEEEVEVNLELKEISKLTNSQKDSLLFEKEEIVTINK